MVLTCSYKFRQASNMWYLTGWEEPNSALVLGKFPARRATRCPAKAAPPCRSYVTEADARLALAFDRENEHVQGLQDDHVRPPARRSR